MFSICSTYGILQRKCETEIRLFRTILIGVALFIQFYKNKEMNRVDDNPYEIF